jgi:hypothetical protein
MPQFPTTDEKSEVARNRRPTVCLRFCGDGREDEEEEKLG